MLLTANSLIEVAQFETVKMNMIVQVMTAARVTTVKVIQIVAVLSPNPNLRLALTSYADPTGSGFISADTFMSLPCWQTPPLDPKLLAMLNPNEFGSVALSERQIELVLRQLDTSGDGFIDANELKHHIQILGQRKVSDEEIQQLFSQVDSNQDGKINIDELVAVMKVEWSSEWSMEPARPPAPRSRDGMSTPEHQTIREAQLKPQSTIVPTPAPAPDAPNLNPAQARASGPETAPQTPDAVPDVTPSSKCGQEDNLKSPSSAFRKQSPEYSGAQCGPGGREQQWAMEGEDTLTA
uniref:EF-hand domain-containing protein n=1 Tax=Haptolina brevifila TaxID=156173 RepID=A0A7S2JD30_9EUKA|mmetsp:Transcript_80446/g.159852  ORF Transcript_80446/g.159852 Transcript_80446/m.159852 type:complete len:295 (+) Transcript_80446:155-1039(+)